MIGVPLGDIMAMLAPIEPTPHKAQEIPALHGYTLHAYAIIKSQPLVCFPLCPLLALRWGNRPTFLWIAEEFGCCASG